MKKDMTIDIRDAADYRLDCAMRWLEETEGRYVTKKCLKMLEECRNAKIIKKENKVK